VGVESVGTFESVSSSISNLAQAAALVIGGAWAYLKFIRGRTFKSRARLELSAERHRYEDDPALLVTVAMQNEGLSKINLSLPNEKFVRVDAISPETWMPDLTLDWDEDAVLLRRVPLLQAHKWLEPGETINDHLLIPLRTTEASLPDAQSSKPIAYRVTARVTQPPRRWSRGTKGQTWTAVLVLPVLLASESAVEAEPSPEERVGPG
jgi:hypothetical protein